VSIEKKKIDFLLFKIIIFYAKKAFFRTSIDIVFKLIEILVFLIDFLLFITDFVNFKLAF